MPYFDMRQLKKASTIGEEYFKGEFPNVLANEKIGRNCSYSFEI